MDGIGGVCSRPKRILGSVPSGNRRSEPSAVNAVEQVPPADRVPYLLGSRATDHDSEIAGSMARAMAIGVLDEMILPWHTQRRLGEALAAAPDARGHHGNIPL